MNTTNDPQYPIYAPIFVGIIYLMRYLAARTKLDNPILQGGNILPAIASLRIILHRKAITGISCWNCEVAIAQNGTKRPDSQPPPALMPLLPSLGLIFSSQFILRSRFKCVQECPSHGIAPHLPVLSFQCGQTFQYPLTTSVSNTRKTRKYQT